MDYADIRLMASRARAWDREYERAGIPSSQRDTPSGVVTWALSNLPFLGQLPENRSGLDVGCGAGRNTRALAQAGFKATGIDFSPAAIELAKARGQDERVSFLQADATQGLAFADASFDVVLDIFVYFHQLSDQARRQYRRELARVMTGNALLVMSLATSSDGYYADCPLLDKAELGSSLQLRWDPHAEVGNILPTPQQFLDEISDCFQVEMTWLKQQSGQMHGGTYQRETLGVIASVKA